ncbi:Pre-mRNA-splicing factor CWC21 [Endocarpon pusillum Z07020]|uniref:Pre-mRNA-splicing factor CWC21 n=1 Tax=Endocarpon pusillum (strain Z07020 / HMAS-L-300199) TaxID=1263415 RepID=U1GBB4_ENDPU|nr:Pre-mRNA-splicing factor CWC21 [Endocarpon pusillum Z07020]ERF69323.1 Pre-mRNA-splicing factor CWC21 [Endocarpon pusillum Z07020]
MSSNVGLTTPRGSGTSGYVQRNLSTLKPRDTGYGAPYPPRNSSNPSSDYSSPLHPRQRQPDQAILAHDRQREVEVKVFELRDQLEDEGELDEDEIEKRCDKLRLELLEEMGGGGSGSGRGGKGKGLKPHQVHELAEAKIKESERLRKALRIKEGREGKAWENTSVKEEEHDRGPDRERDTRR